MRRKRASNFKRNGNNLLPAKNAMCNQEVDTGGISSYVELQVCLEMERDVKQE